MTPSRSENFCLLLLPILALFPPMLMRIRGLHSPPILAFTLAGLSLGCILLGLALVYTNQADRSQSRFFSFVRIALIAIVVFTSIDIAYGGAKLLESISTYVKDLGEDQRLPFQVVFVFVSTFAIGFVVRLLRENAAFILAAAFGAFFVSTLILPDENVLENWSKESAPAGEEQDPGPTQIYIILDSMIGLEGIDRSLDGGEEFHRVMMDFHERHGFKLYGRAFSRHYKTRDSVPRMLNQDFSVETKSQRLTAKAHGTMFITQNAFLDRFGEQNREVVIYQIPYLSFCRHPAVQRCVTLAAYNPYNGYMPKEIELNLLVTSALGLKHVLRVQTLVGRVLSNLFYSAVGFIVHEGGTPYMLSTKRSRFGVHASVLWFDDFRRDVLRSERGTVFLAHFMFPHFPFIFDAECRPKLKTQSRSFEKGGSLRLNEGSKDARFFNERGRRYEEYFEQARCAFRKLDELVVELEESERLADSIIVLMGDHGSRISGGQHFDTVDERDLVDNHSTLFSIRRPDQRPGYQPRMISTQQLFGAILFGDIEAELAKVEGTVMLKSKSDSLLHPTPMPYFSFASEH